jgi:hypothetical protein
MTITRTEPWKRAPALSALVAMLLISGCSSRALKAVVLDVTKRAPTERVDVFRNGETPQRRFKAIGEFSFEGKENEEEKALALFVSQGKKMGAQALMTEKHVSRFVQHGDFGRENFYLFEARAAVYE